MVVEGVVTLNTGGSGNGGDSGARGNGSGGDDGGAGGKVGVIKGDGAKRSG